MGSRIVPIGDTVSNITAFFSLAWSTPSLDTGLGHSRPWTHSFSSWTLTRPNPNNFRTLDINGPWTKILLPLDMKFAGLGHRPVLDMKRIIWKDRQVFDLNYQLNLSLKIKKTKDYLS